MIDIILTSSATGDDGYCRRFMRPAVRLSVPLSVSLSVRPERRYGSNSWTISFIILQFSRVMYSNMKRIGI